MAEINSQDLTHETLLQSVARMQVGAFRQPALGGIPLLSRIGQGEGGCCYRAVHPTLECEVAVKVMAYSAERSERFGIFLAHARAAMGVESPHLVKVFDVGTEADVFFQVMEYMDCRSAQAQLSILRERLKPGMDEASVLDLCIAATEGLKAAHDSNFIHRDIRPSAILIPKGGGGEGDTMLFAQAKLADLGLAFNEATARMLEGSPAQTGTPGYMSPEEAVGSKDVSAASDVFSIGATIYSLLVGQPPFGGPSLSVVLSATVIQESNDLRTWRPDVSRATAKIVEGCLKKASAARFPNAGVLLKALKLAKDAFNGTVEAQAAAVREIDALLPNVAKLDPAIQQFLDSSATEAVAADNLSSDPDLVEIGNEPTMIAKPMSFPAVPSPVAPAAQQSEDVDALAQQLIAKPGSPKTDLINATPNDVADNQVWEEPANANADVDVMPRRRGISVPLMAAALLAVAAGVGAWQLGYLGPKKPLKVVLAGTGAGTGTGTAVKPPPGGPPNPDKPATPDKEKTDADAKAKLDAEKAKADADAKAKADEDKRIADSAAAAAAAEQKKQDELKAQQEAAQKKDEEDKRLAEAAKAKAAEEAKATEEAAAKQKAAEEEKRVAEAAAKAKADEAKAAEDAAAKAKADAEVAARVKAEQDEAERKRIAAEKEKTDAEKPRVVETKAPPPATASSSPAAEADLPRELTLDLGNGVRMDFVLVPAGSFMMGTNRDALSEIARKAVADVQDYADEVPAHHVEVATFYIARTPTTVGQFRGFVSATQYRTAAERNGSGYTLVDRNWQLTPGASWMKPGFPQGDDHPVVNVNWRDCAAFAEWAGKQSGKALRLTAEAEWEYAARGAANNIYPWGNTWDGKRANHSDAAFRPFGPKGWMYSNSDDAYAFTSPVGAFKNQSWCGAFDMAGNVFQWCQDGYTEYPQSATTPEIIADPADTPTNAKRPVRGGSYLFRPIDCRCAARRSLSPSAWSYELGMRLAFSPK